jgi:ABC-type uncharacterized transport system ATPase subunit
MSGRQARRRAIELLEDFGPAQRRKAKVHQLSGGQTKKLMIAQALIHRPDVLFLDEPTAGVDPQARLHLWDLLRDLRGRGLTYLLTTHNLAETEALCDRIAIMNHGQVLASGSSEELTLAAGAETIVTASYDGAAPPEIKRLADRAGVSRVAIDGGQARVFARGARCTQSTGCRRPPCSTRWCTCPKGCGPASTPGVPHLPIWSILAVLGGGCAAMGALSIALFYRRVVA